MLHSKWEVIPVLTGLLYVWRHPDSCNFPLPFEASRKVTGANSTTETWALMSEAFYCEKLLFLARLWIINSYVKIHFYVLNQEIFCFFPSHWAAGPNIGSLLSELVQNSRLSQLTLYDVKQSQCLALQRSISYLKVKQNHLVSQLWLLHSFILRSSQATVIIRARPNRFPNCQKGRKASEGFRMEPQPSQWDWQRILKEGSVFERQLTSG